MTASEDLRGVHLWLLLSRAAHTIEAVARRSVETTGLCLSDFGALEALLHKGPLSVGALQEKVLLSSGSMTAAVDRLAERGLVERREIPGDRRSREIHLTPQGRELIGQIFTRHEADMESAFEALDEPERKRLSTTLRKLGKRGLTA